MFENIQFIEANGITEIKPLEEGWSDDKKYILKDQNGVRYILRVSDKAKYNKKLKQYELLRRIAELDINCSKALDFGTLADGSVYMILSFLEGEDGIKAVSNMSDSEAYTLGIEAGKILRKLHGISIPVQNSTWWDAFQRKFPKRLAKLEACPIRLEGEEELVKFYKDNAYLVEHRPLVFTHGDYHLGNMIVKDGKIGIIDFDRNEAADPYDDLKPFCWNAMRSESFENGLINGYFANNVPADFWPILKLYTVEGIINIFPWAVGFGEKELETSYEVVKNLRLWYDDFKLDIPSWYKGTNPKF